MSLQNDGFGKILNSYLNPYYKVHQQSFTVIALLGVTGNLIFYIYLEYFTNYYESVWLRLADAFLLGSIFFFPRNRDLKKWEIWSMEIIFLLALPIFFTVMLYLNDLNQFWTFCLLMGMTTYGLLSDPLKGMVLFPIVYFIILYIQINFFNLADEKMIAALDLFFPTYLIAIILGALQVIARMAFQELELKNKIIEENKLELENSRDLAEKANKAKSSFLANMSHEIRTPLNSIIGFSQILAEQNKDGTHSADTSQYLHFIKNAGEHLAELINNVLDLSKIEAGKMSTCLQPVNLERLTRGIYHLHHSQANQKGLKFTYSIDDVISEYLLSDRTKINQILNNLVANAIKFSEQGTVNLSVRLMDNKVLFSVKDEGIGITKKRQEAIFNAFEQEDNTTTRRFGGSGLGLTICKHLTELLGGNIWIESEPNRGSQFFVSIPYHPVHASSEDPAETDLKNLSKTLSDKTILIVEDDRMNQLVIQGLLKKYDVNMQVAENGRDAISLLKKMDEDAKQPDLIFMDLHMPVMDGIEALRIIRENENWKSIPVIALTADALEEQKFAGIRQGFADYLTKPLLQEELRKVLTYFLSDSQQVLISK